MEFINQYWYVLIGGTALLLLYLQYSKNKNIGTINNSDLALIIEAGFYILIIVSLQDYLFNSHVFWIIPFFIFVPVWAGIIWMLLNRGNYYLIESRMQGQEFYKLGLIPENPEIAKEITRNTGLKIHIMDKEVFESKEHFGDDFSPRYNAGNNIKHCDYFDGDTIYHPEYPDLQNITFWNQVVKFVHLKEMVVEIMRENLVLSDLSNIKILKNIKTLRKNLKTTLTGLEIQYEHEPYNIENKLKEYWENAIKEKHKGKTEKESKSSEKTNESIGTEE